jgi:multiple sugar transport system permease protein
VGRRRRWSVAVLAAVLGGFTLVALVPVLWGLLISIKNPVDAFAVPPKLIFRPTGSFHYRVWFEEGFLRYLFNSTVIALATAAISVPAGTMAAYALARLRTRWTRSLLLGLLLVRMFPHILLAIPFFVLARALGLYDTYLAMVLAMVAINQPFTIWLMRSFFVDVPVELDEAARIDGATEWQVLVRVLVPVVRPGLVVASLFSLLLAYNEFLFALVLTGTRTRPLPVAIASYGAEDINYWSISAAGAIGITLPIVLFMALSQRHMVRGLTSGAVK